MYVPAPRSIYQGIFKLEAGLPANDCRHAARSSTSGHRCDPRQVAARWSVRRWWSLADIVEGGARNPITDKAEALSALWGTPRRRGRAAVTGRCAAGRVLEWWVDSSAIVALMQQQTSRPIKTFTVGFEESG